MIILLQTKKDGKNEYAKNKKQDEIRCFFRLTGLDAGMCDLYWDAGTARRSMLTDNGVDNV